MCQRQRKANFKVARDASGLGRCAECCFEEATAAKDVHSQDARSLQKKEFREKVFLFLFLFLFVFLFLPFVGSLSRW